MNKALVGIVIITVTVITLVGGLEIISPARPVHKGVDQTHQE
jgi:hypothetical protein